MPGLQYPKEFSHWDEVKDWITGIVPGADEVDTEQIRDTLIWAVNSGLDEGVRFDVTGADGREYAMEIGWNVTGKPTHNRTAAVPDAKLENRINSVEVELSAARARGWGGYVDLGGYGRLGTTAAAALSSYATVGKGVGRNRAYQYGSAAARYMYLKPDDKIGQLDVPVTWMARLRDTKTGRWKDFTFTRDGAPRPETIRTYASLHEMLADHRDPEPVLSNLSFPLWRMHDAVQRTYVADKLQAAVRKMLGEDEYAFWNRDQEIELFLSNDRIGAELADLHKTHPLRPGTPDWQSTVRIVLRRDGRNPTLTLAAEAVSRKDIGEPTSKVKFDRLSQSVHKASSTRERRIGTRGIDVGGPANPDRHRQPFPPPGTCPQPGQAVGPQPDRLDAAGNAGRRPKQGDQARLELHRVGHLGRRPGPARPHPALPPSSPDKAEPEKLAEPEQATKPRRPNKRPSAVVRRPLPSGRASEPHCDDATVSGWAHVRIRLERQRRRHPRRARNGGHRRCLMIRASALAR